MSNEIAPLANVDRIGVARRAIVEQKLNMAIEKARRQYIEVDTLHKKKKMPTVGPSHLGSRLDVRA